MSALESLSDDQLGAFVAHAKANGGASMSWRTGSILQPGTTAYMVGGHPDKAGNRIDSAEPVPASEFEAHHVRDYLNQVGSLVDPVDRSGRLGAWHNPEDDQVYLDVSSHMLDPDTAVKAGRARNEIAIYDNKNSRDIQTGGNGQNF